MPSPSGSLTSVMTMSTGPWPSTAAATARLSAVTTSKPSFLSMIASSSRMDCSSSTTRMRFFTPGSAASDGHGHQGQADLDLGPLGGRALHRDVAAVLAHDAVDDGQAEAGAHGRRRSGRARTCAAAPPGPSPAPGPARRARARPRVPAEAHAEAAPAGHGLQPVAGEVPEDLGDLVGIGQADVGPLVGLELHHVVRAHLGPVAQQRHRLRDEGPQVHRPARAAGGPGLEEEPVQGVREALATPG